MSRRALAPDRWGLSVLPVRFRCGLWTSTSPWRESAASDPRHGPTYAESCSGFPWSAPGQAGTPRTPTPTS